jgi:ethanolamine ammonia-lyase large subunit
MADTTISHSAISHLRELIFSDAALAAQLYEITDQANFIAAVANIASANGILLGENEVREAINAGTRSWLERWI